MAQQYKQVLNYREYLPWKKTGGAFVTTFLGQLKYSLPLPRVNERLNYKGFHASAVAYRQFIGNLKWQREQEYLR